MATNNSTAIPRRVKDLTGQRFGRLTVLEYAGLSKFGTAQWLCRCDCGGSHVAVIRKGREPGCGCLHLEAVTSHGQYGSPEYRSWSSMLARCYTPSNHAYTRYGGRGITVCDRWRTSFGAFYKDMGKRPSLGCSIERLDNDSGYHPDNCVWATPTEQARNRKNNHILHYNGQAMCLAAWAEQVGIHPDTIAQRLDRGWPIKRALTEPVHLRHTPAGSTESVKPS